MIKLLELVLFYSDLKDAIEKRPYVLNGQDSIYYDGEKMKCVKHQYKFKK